MKFVALTYGTQGDTRPLAVLCRALMDAGHGAMLLADGATLNSARAVEVPHAALAGNIRGELGSDGAITSVVTGKNTINATAKALARIANANVDAWMRQAAAATQGCDAIIVSGLAAFAGLSVAEYLGIRAIGAGLIPISPTCAFPSPFLPPNWVPPLVNRTSHRFVNAMLWRAFRKATNDARMRALRLPPRRAVWTEHPMLYGISPSLMSTPPDWPAHTRLCGQWLQPSDRWSAPAALQDFLDAGEAPMYVGFGSMTGFDQARLLREVVAAVDGRRALLYPGWSGINGNDLPDNFLVIGDTPHDWLLPRTSLAVHHGGSGTSHSACRAGVPSVVLPFAGDQFFWADRLRRLGVAARAVSTKNLKAARLAHGIAFAESTDARLRAKALGEKMTVENGPATAVAAIDAVMRTRRE